MSATATTSSGFLALDELIGELNPGDNVVWRFDEINDYRAYAARFVNHVVKLPGRHVLYFRFAAHDPVIAGDVTAAFPNIEVIELPLEGGFENFITRVHAEIERVGAKGVFIFDTLSEMSRACYSDRMIGNFFRLTCPFIQSLGALAYFGLQRHLHSYHTIEPIRDATQVLLDVYRYADHLYVRPVKTEGQHEDSTFTLYQDFENRLVPINESVRIAEIINSKPWPGLASTSYRMVGVWDRVFMDAETVEQQRRDGLAGDELVTETIDQLLSLIVSRDDRVLSLARRYFSLSDVIAIWKRMIGTGYIGGKSIGMLLARAILRSTDDAWNEILEQHDSFFIGSDVYYTYLVINDVWWERQQQKDPERFLEPEAGIKILDGTFPSYIVERFEDMLDYFGRSPIIVRSSSLMEDNFGNAFAGKYDSIFCTNQGTRAQRLSELLDAVRRVYASSVSDQALEYRKARGLLDQDEQMALLVQRVSGAPYDSLFFPQLAGVGFSYNPYAWHPDIEPTAGMMRLVFGLGTRAVDRADDDYTRVVALNAPEKQPQSGFEEVKRHAQRRADVLDLQEGAERSVHFVDVLKQNPKLPLHLFGTQDRDLLRNRSVDRNLTWVLTFERLFKETDFVERMRALMKTLKEAYATEVDIEFTANFLEDGSYRVNVVQCRPLQVQGIHLRPTPLPDLEDSQVILRAHGGVVGHSRVTQIHRVVYVYPHAYSRLSEQERYLLAEVLGTVTHVGNGPGFEQMLIGPGRWGTSTPSLGIPVSFQHIKSAGVLCEIDTIHEGLVADLSLGTHFFNELVEMNLLYVAFFSGHRENLFRVDYLERQPNLLPQLSPDHLEWTRVVRVVEPPDGTSLFLNADSRRQLVVLYEQ